MYDTIKIKFIISTPSKRYMPLVVKHGQVFPIDILQDADNTVIFYIRSHALPNLLLALFNSTFKVYDPLLPSDSIPTQASTINKLILKTNYYIRGKLVKDATSVENASWGTAKLPGCD